MKNKRAKQPFPAGVRVRNKPSKVKMQSNGDGITLRYTSLGDVQTTTSSELSVSTDRIYVPGYLQGMISPTGPSIASNYSTGVFKPGTTIRWEPACGATTSGRVFVAWTSNPELMQAWAGASTLAKYNIINACGSVRSFPVWQETEIPFPNNLRRKRFDVNSELIDTAEGRLAQLARSAQVMMMAVISGPADTVLGQFNYHDVLDLEGMVPNYTYILNSQLQRDDDVKQE